MTVGMEESPNLSGLEDEEREDFTGVKNKDLTKKQRQARRAAKRGDYTDRNLDGIPDRDQLDWDEVSAEWQWIRNLIAEIPEIEGLFEQAVADGAFESQTGINNFINNVIDSEWWKENGPSAREAFAIRTSDPAAYAEMLDDARVAVEARARELGAQLDSATIENMANRYVTDGWSQRGYLMDRALADKIGVTEGPAGAFVPGDFAEQLRRIAINNGLNFDNEYYLSAARSVASGLRSEDQWIQDVRQQAASYWPAYSEQILAGTDARSLASGYINIMSRTLEIDPFSISLDDPFIRKATTMLDDSGNPRPMSLWEFQQDLRNDPRWMNTDQAVKSQVDIGANILRRFGML